MFIINKIKQKTSFAKNCMPSDTNTTGILFLSLEQAKEFLSHHRDLEAYLIYSDDNGNYQVFQTSGLKTFINETDV